ncbi:carbohydrate kinase family protein [Halorubrum salsamenti]|uniref:carbohydrate kinase family protein n=1 Tax=Halorubrum salsamenti TaxID=2583990 RepID=UPI0011A8BA13|nr:carbohydrate kinase family protein [Halorubrum salsamenti]
MTGPPPILAVGAAAIDEWYAVSNLPEPDGGAFASEVTTAFGGVGANVCVALDRLGREVGLVSRVGDDEYGRQALDHLADTGVDASRVSVGDDPSTRSVILSDPAGERAIVTAGESFRRLQLDEADREALAAAETVFLTGYTPDAVSRAVLDTIESAADPPALVFDLSGPVEELVDRSTEPETVHRLLHAADLFVAGDVAAAAYFGGPEAAVGRVAAAQRAREDDGQSSLGGDGWPRAVLTHGADGMTVVAGGEVTEIDAFDVDVVDATGAGDSFVAALIDRWIAGGDDSRAERVGVEDGVRFAAAVAAINCTSRFTQPGLPTRDEVEAFLAERGF